MDTNSLIILLIVIIVFLIVFILKKSTHKSVTKISASSHEELLEKMKQNNVSEEMLNVFEDKITKNNTFSTYTTTSTTHKVTYVNGQKVSEENNTTHNKVVPLTNCPNCGAKIKDRNKDNCEYCHTILKTK